MSTDVALQAMFDRFLGRFVLPLVGEGEVLVSFPLGLGAVDYFRYAEPSEGNGLSELSRLRTDVLAQIIQTPTPLELIEDEVYLLASLHNILLSSHQDLVAGFRGGTRWQHCLSWAQEHLAEVSPCGTAEQALARHSLLHQITELNRMDSVVRTRRSTRRYLGQDPPKRALIWPKLRRVRQSAEEASFSEVIDSTEARLTFTALLDLSPLTCLLTMPSATTGGVYQDQMSWSPAAVMVLSRPDLCRTVTYRHLEMGLPLVGPHLAAGLIEELKDAGGSGSPGGSRAAFALRYIINLQLTLCWTSTLEELEKVVETSWGQDAEETRRLFFGWFAVAMAREDRLGAPRSTGDLQHRETTYRRAAARAAGQTLEEAAAQVDFLVPPWQEAENRSHG